MSVDKVVVVVELIERNMVLAGEAFLLKSKTYGASLNLSNLIFFHLKNMVAHRL